MGWFAERMVTVLDRCPPHDVGHVAVGLLEELDGVESAVVWVCDFAHSRLIDLRSQMPYRSIPGSIEGVCFTSGEPIETADGVHIPLGRRGQRLGVISLTGSGVVLDRMLPAGVAIANALVAGSGQSDALGALRGAARLELPATIQHQLLPMPSCHGPDLELAAQIEPAYDIAGDAFDYSVGADAVHFGVFDAVGHGLRATLIATTLVGAYRRARQRADSMTQVAASVDLAVSEMLEPGEFCTGVIARIDRRLRRIEIWNAGHLPPVLVRHGEAITLHTGLARLPFGLGPPDESPSSLAPSTTFDIEAGDLLVAYTDGVAQARNPEGRMLGDNAIAEIVAGRAADEPLLHLCSRVLAEVSQHVERRLSDDATIMAVGITR